MKLQLRMLALLGAGALVFVSVAAASPAAGQQRLTMNVSKKEGPSGGAFTLTPVGSGPLNFDSGTFTFTGSQKKLVRGGQSVIVFTAIETWKGKLGTFVIHEQIDDVGIAQTYRVGTGLWSFVGAKGTGQYAGVHASGRSAYVLTPSGRVIFQWEGLVT